MRNPRSGLSWRLSWRTISVRCGSPACPMVRALSCRARTSFAKAIWSTRSSPRPAKLRNADAFGGQAAMSRFIDYAISHARLTIVTLLFLLGAGFVAYVTIPKEAEPDVRIPIVYVQLTQRGISPEDSERLLLRVVETQLKSVNNVKDMRSTAFEGGGFVLLEFEPGLGSRVGVAGVPG